VSKRKLTLTVHETSRDTVALIEVHAINSKGHEVFRVTAPRERRSDAVWRASMEGIDRGYAVEGP